MTGPDIGPAADDWRHRGACREHDPELWFSEVSSHQAEAIEICHGCEVLTQCGLWAWITDQRYGIWGGYLFGTRP